MALFPPAPFCTAFGPGRAPSCANLFATPLASELAKSLQQQPCFSEETHECLVYYAALPAWFQQWGDAMKSN